MASEHKNGQMEPSTKVNGPTTKLKAKENSHIPTVITIKENGLTTKLTVLAPTFTAKQEQGTKAIGKTTCNTVRAWKSIVMVTSMKACSSKAKETGKVPTTMQLDKSTKEDGLTVGYKALVLANGLMAKNMKDSGRTTKNTVKAYTPGLMVANMKETIETTRNTDKELTLGQIIDSI